MNAIDLTPGDSVSNRSPPLLLYGNLPVEYGQLQDSNCDQFSNLTSLDLAIEFRRPCLRTKSTALRGVDP
jgi:hypothetical protein